MKPLFNPCYPFSSELLEAMLARGVLHFVRSTYPRGAAGDAGGCTRSFLISHYHQQADAERHFHAIRGDRYRFLYDGRLAAHVDRLRAASTAPAGYRVYSRVLAPGIERKAGALFREHTRRYLFRHTHWDLRGRIVVEPELYFQLGELYVRMAHRGDEIKVKFEELENS